MILDKKSRQAEQMDIDEKVIVCVAVYLKGDAI